MNDQVNSPALDLTVGPASACVGRPPEPLVEFAIYFLAAAVGLAVDATLLVALVQGFGVGHVAAAASGFVAGAFAVYLLSVKFAFSHRCVRSPRVEFLIFLAIGLSGLLVTVAIMWAGVDMFKVDYRLSKAVAAGASFLVNFALRKLILFSAR